MNIAVTKARKNMVSIMPNGIVDGVVMNNGYLLGQLQWNNLGRILLTRD